MRIQLRNFRLPFGRTIIMMRLLSVLWLCNTGTSFCVAPPRRCHQTDRRRPIGPSKRRNTLARRPIRPSIGSTMQRYSVPNVSFAIPKSSSSCLPTLYMSLLALQFATQPILTKRYAPKSLVRSTYVLCQDIVRFSLSLALLWINKTRCVWDWNLLWSTACFPAVLYLLQSYSSLMAYQHLSPITYNVLNQTKTLSGALFCYLLFRQRQSQLQMVALLVLLLAALVMENIVTLPSFSRPNKQQLLNSQDDELITVLSESERQTYLFRGLVPILLASLLSGLAGAWTQQSLQGLQLNSFFLTLQMSLFSMTFLGTSLLWSGDGKQVRSGGWWQGWTLWTWIPIVTNASGGILVGLVTKHCGVVPKGFALIVGMFLSGILQNAILQTRVTPQQWCGGLLAAMSIWMHSSFPVAK